MKVSVITACWNAGAHIERCLASIRSQQDVELEHILVDGLSTDNTLEILERYRQEAPYCVKIHSGPDNGIYDAMNLGIEIAEGDLLNFLNSDDYYFQPRSLAWVVNAVEMSPQALLHCFQTLVLNEKTGQSLLTRHARLTRFYLYKMGLSHPSTFFAREAFQLCGNYRTDMHLAADYEFFQRSILKNCITVSCYPILTSVFTTGGASTAGGAKSRVREEMARSRRLYFPTWERAFYENKLVEFCLEYEWLRFKISRLPFPFLRELR